jgi:hypothetical protein
VISSAPTHTHRVCGEEFDPAAGPWNARGMTYAIVQSTTEPRPRPTSRPAPFFGDGERVREGEARSVDGALRLVESHRRLDCRHYDSCLELAANAGWRGWSCCECELGVIAERRPTTGRPRVALVAPAPQAPAEATAAT